MNRKPYRHMYTPLRSTANGGKLALIDDRAQEITPMFEGQKIACNIARDRDCDVRHEVYNDPLRRWDFLGIYHPDGTCTLWTGERKLFTDDPVRPWADLSR
ncbi:MAG: hypothetical protein HDR97_00520 [Bacteroides sp.]|nr:hypothetical protein [Bacteroides sp.]